MDKEKLLALAERCEAATADEQRLLIIESAEAILLAQGHDPDSEDAMGFVDRLEDLINANAYLDAAMTLVPEGCVWWMPFPNDARIGDADGHVLNPLPQRCATPALALCAAALRARAAMEADNGRD